ncbi:hypothetical protein [Serratia marcescens]
MGLVSVIEELDVLHFEAHCQVGCQGSLTLHGCPNFLFGELRHLSV